MLDVEAQTTEYSTGELAALCGVSVRTVQYYDEKGLLPPSEVSEGGRRIYTDADVSKLRKIQLLKSLGLRLSAIRGVLESDASAQVMLDILREQDRKLEVEAAQNRDARATIGALVRGLEEQGELPAESISDMATIMKNEHMQEQQLKRVYRTMAGIAVPIGIAEIAAFVHWIRKGNWKPFAAVELMAVPAAVALARYYRERVAYQCPHCHEVFKPDGLEWFLAMHTPTTRKLSCVACGKTDWCTEVSASALTPVQK